ncbi:RimJ/RimL family protein N-acetyltransferase [Rubricella aquisinus]|uniref:RimJ/RimL family protein N-acetyltransferase n=1 Tax=Rubricella aquisinus TaxID=2028108 RepID=A0A840X3C3_9RHOB|nr:GNAT family N-acetyltransferase [Rubricella aquisinus]MBB5516345.1 RimJ/RimL family protein N-acetyltransferase [Rubricella aquisinus]
MIHAQIRTPRLLIRAATRADAGLLAQHITPAISRWTAAWRPDMTTDAVEQLITPWLEGAARGDTFPGIIERRDRGEMIGWMKIGLADGLADLSYWIAAPAQRQGFAREAADGTIRFAFDTLGANAVTAGAQSSNAASHALLAALGLRPDGRRDVYAPARDRMEPCDFWRIDRPG